MIRTASPRWRRFTCPGCGRPVMAKERRWRFGPDDPPWILRPHVLRPGGDRLLCNVHYVDDDGKWVRW